MNPVSCSCAGATKPPDRAPPRHLSLAAINSKTLDSIQVLVAAEIKILIQHYGLFYIRWLQPRVLIGQEAFHDIDSSTGTFGRYYHSAVQELLTD